MTDERPLLLCFDASEDSRRAIAQAAALMPGRSAVVATAWQSLAGLMLHTDPGGLGGTMREAADEVDSADREGTGQTAEQGAELARSLGLEAEAVSLRSDHRIWPELLELAGERDAAMVVVGERGLTGIETALLGSVAHGVLHHSERPVLLATTRAREENSGRLLLCYDGSDAAERAIAEAAHQLGRREADVITAWRAIASVAPAARIGAPDDVVLTATQKLEAESERRALALAEKGALEAERQGFTGVRAIAHRGTRNVWASLVSAAQEHQPAVLVTGSRGYGAVRSALLGSVSRGVATHAPVPVLVVPPGR